MCRKCRRENVKERKGESKRENVTRYIYRSLDHSVELHHDNEEVACSSLLYLPTIPIIAHLTKVLHKRM